MFLQVFDTFGSNTLGFWSVWGVLESSTSIQNPPQIVAKAMEEVMDIMMQVRLEF